MSDVTPKLVYDTVIEANAKIIVAQLAKQLNLSGSKFLAMLAEHCSKERLPLPEILWEKPVPAVSPVVYRANDKAHLNLTATRLGLADLQGVLKFEVRALKAGTSIVIGEETTMLDANALLVLPLSNPVDPTEVVGEIVEKDAKPIVTATVSPDQLGSIEPEKKGRKKKDEVPEAMTPTGCGKCADGCTGDCPTETITETVVEDAVNPADLVETVRTVEEIEQLQQPTVTETVAEENFQFEDLSEAFDPASLT